MQKIKASVTTSLSLCMVLFLTFCIVLMEGTRVYYLRCKAMAAMELAEFSILSEYQKELFEDYGLFFLDLDYEQGREQNAILESRLENYLQKNLEEGETESLSASNFRRATDGGGTVFLLQAVEQVKADLGYQIWETLFDGMGNVKPDAVDLEEILNASESQLPDLALPDLSFPSVKALRTAIFENEESLSDKSMVPSERLLKRAKVQGVGEAEGVGFAQMQLFDLYLFQNFSYYGSENEEVPKEALEYQLEYIIAGEDSDAKNLENIMWRIFLLRAGGNYLFYHQDAGQLAKAEAKAAAWVGFTANLVLIQLVRELFLIAQAIEDGIEQTKTVFLGETVPLYENGVFAGISLGYEQYLYLFLKAAGKEEKVYRSMDVIELEVRKSSGYEDFRLDHCVDGFEVDWTYCYEGLIQSQRYEHTIQRKINYEM